MSTSGTFPIRGSKKCREHYNKNKFKLHDALVSRSLTADGVDYILSRSYFLVN